MVSLVIQYSVRRTDELTLVIGNVIQIDLLFSEYLQQPKAPSTQND